LPSEAIIAGEDDFNDDADERISNYPNMLLRSLVSICFSAIGIKERDLTYPEFALSFFSRKSILEEFINVKVHLCVVLNWHFFISSSIWGGSKTNAFPFLNKFLDFNGKCYLLDENATGSPHIIMTKANFYNIIKFIFIGNGGVMPIFRSDKAMLNAFLQETPHEWSLMKKELHRITSDLNEQVPNSEFRFECEFLLRPKKSQLELLNESKFSFTKLSDVIADNYIRKGLFRQALVRITTIQPLVAQLEFIENYVCNTQNPKVVLLANILINNLLTGHFKYHFLENFQLKRNDSESVWNEFFETHIELDCYVSKDKRIDSFAFVKQHPFPIMSFQKVIKLQHHRITVPAINGD